MTPQERLQQDLQRALKDGKAPQKSAICLVRVAVMNEEIANLQGKG